MAAYTVRALTLDTWDAYAALLERHNGVWGGCWCLAFHPPSPERGQSPAGNRAVKQRLVEAGLANAAVVMGGDRAIGWCQYGTPEELPSIYHRKEYEAGLAEPADYRITCFFVDRDHRRGGVSAVALRGALDLIGKVVATRWRSNRKTPRARRSRPRSSTTAPATWSSAPASRTSVPRGSTIA